MEKLSLSNNIYDVNYKSLGLIVSLLWSFKDEIRFRLWQSQILTYQLQKLLDVGLDAFYVVLKFGADR